jgi:hypothetical protein
MRSLLGRHNMLDLLYVLGTLLFFALMIGYVRGCNALGHDSDSKESAS